MIGNASMSARNEHGWAFAVLEHRDDAGPSDLFGNFEAEGLDFLAIRAADFSSISDSSGF